MPDPVSLQLPPLQGAPAAAAIIVSDDGGYLLQLRDDVPHIWYPGYWGCFGGAMEESETPEGALRRELIEELGFVPRQCDYFARFDFSFFGRQISRYYYVIRVTHAEVASMRLGEGADMRVFRARECFETLRMVGYDQFALYLHDNSARFDPSPSGSTARQIGHAVQKI